MSEANSSNAMRNNNALIQALMIQIVYQVNTVHWNIYQRHWVDDSSCCEWLHLAPTKIGNLEITIQVSDDGDSWATFSFDGISVQTEICGKRLFHYGVHSPVLSDSEWVVWFNRILDELDRESQKDIGLMMTAARS